MEVLQAADASWNERDPYFRVWEQAAYQLADWRSLSAVDPLLAHAVPAVRASTAPGQLAEVEAVDLEARVRHARC